MLQGRLKPRYSRVVVQKIDIRRGEMRLPDPPPGPIKLDYSFFDFLVCRVKRSAIDAYVCREFDMHIVGDHYEYPSSYGSDVWVLRPDENGEGGGTRAWNDGALPDDKNGDGGGLVDKVGWLADIFDPESKIPGTMDDIRSRIDGIVYRWQSLPAPGKIQDQVEAWQEVYKVIDMPGSAEAAEAGEDSLLLNVSRVRDIVNGDSEHGTGPALESGAADRFKGYIDGLYDAVIAFRDVALTLGVAMAAQCELWTAARQDVATTLARVADKLDQIAAGASDDSLTATYEVAGILLTAAGLFTGGMGTVVVTGLSVGLTIVSSEGGDPSDSQPVSGYSSVLDALDALLNASNRILGLNGRIKDAEKSVQKNLDDNIAVVKGNPSTFEPIPGPIDSTDRINRPERTVTNTIYSLMDDIAGLLTLVGDRTRGCASAAGMRVRVQNSLVDRDSEIGIGRTGPTDDFVKLADLLGTAAYTLSGEVDEARKNLRAAMDALDEVDAGTQAALLAAANEFSGYDGP